ncbi:hypothetical protein GGR51DRAFT_528517 [Nemania sp. FL0031]|nr:hypothetical protein GGR51DRAFT_528514 [Nemania sp. FL0031]KAI0102080.1 hypothetical protein GGR51DRAFT_528517 [Nemania sp. FL0031]
MGEEVGDYPQKICRKSWVTVLARKVCCGTHKAQRRHMLQITPPRLTPLPEGLVAFPMLPPRSTMPLKSSSQSYYLEGDEVALVVRGRLAPFVPWSESTQYSFPEPCFYMPAISVPNYVCVGDAIVDARANEQPWLVRNFTVSLSKLAGNSSWFRNWSLISPACPGYFSLEVVDLNAFSILMDIFHGRPEGVPTVVNLEMLAKIAELVKVLGCHKALDNHPQRWINELLTTQPLCLATGRDLLLWLHVSLVFQDQKNSDSIKYKLLLRCKGTFHSLGLSLDDNVVALINEWRVTTLKQIFGILQDFMIRLRMGTTQFSDHYEAILLGLLYKQLPSSYFTLGGLGVSLLRVSINDVVDNFFKLEAPHWEVPCNRMAKRISYSKTEELGTEDLNTGNDTTKPFTRDSNGFQQLIGAIVAVLDGLPERIGHNGDDL